MMLTMASVMMVACDGGGGGGDTGGVVEEQYKLKDILVTTGNNPLSGFDEGAIVVFNKQSETLTIDGKIYKKTTNEALEIAFESASEELGEALTDINGLGDAGLSAPVTFIEGTNFSNYIIFAYAFNVDESAGQIRYSRAEDGAITAGRADFSR